MASMGQLLTLGMVVTLVATLIMLPALLTLMRRRHDGARHGRERLRRRGRRARAARARARRARAGAARQRPRQSRRARMSRSPKATSHEAIAAGRRSPVAATFSTSRPTTGSGPPTRGRCTDTNVDGSLNMLEAAAWGAGVERLVYTSSVAVLGIHADRSPADEESPVTIDDMVGHYKRSKFLAERAVKRAPQELGVPVVIVNPVDADRSRRRQADADRAHHRRRRARPDAGFRRYGPQYRARGRRRARALLALERGRARRALHPWRRGHDAQSRS